MGDKSSTDRISAPKDRNRRASFDAQAEADSMAAGQTIYGGDPALSPQHIMQLQRVCGNAFVSRLVQNRARHAAPPVKTSAPRNKAQRKVGFEAEFSIPSLSKPPDAATKLNDGPDGDKPTAEIEQFLFGGLDYGVNRGANTHFTLKPDHNELQDKMNKILNKLNTMALLKEIPAKTTSNLEYVTTALDELAPGSTTKFTAQFNAIKNHANTAAGSAKTSLSQLGAPAVDTYTGVPEAALQLWLGSKYGEVQGLVDDFKASVKNEFYLQATVGIIPSALRDLHQRHTPARLEDAVDIPGAAMAAVNMTVTNFLNHDTIKKKPYIKELLEGKEGGVLGIGAKAPNPIDYETFAGILHLIYMNMVGSALNQTSLFDGSSKKNSVPFMSKMTNMRNIITKAAPSFNKNRPPESLITLIDEFFKKTTFTKVDWWLSKFDTLQDRRGVEGREATVKDTFVSDMLISTSFWETDPIATAANTGKSRQFTEPDEVPGEVGTASSGQKGAQFEYRYISARPNADGLAAELKKVIDEVRLLNTKHMPLLAKTDMINQADT